MSENLTLGQLRDHINSLIKNDASYENMIVGSHLFNEASDRNLFGFPHSRGFWDEIWVERELVEEVDEVYDYATTEVYFEEDEIPDDEKDNFMKVILLG